MELLGAKVVNEYMERKQVLQGTDGEVLVEDGGHRRVVEGKHGDGEPAVYLAGKVGNSEVVVERGELRVFGEDTRDVMGMGGGHGHKEEHEEGHAKRHGGKRPHWLHYGGGKLGGGGGGGRAAPRQLGFRLRSNGFACIYH
ncbi:hypothetical protein MLD38_025149 [Melastoma candidum]|uniref:Uncharacterized protein n=1 Tax=Melastoma candidum TaxID=119954 RepID=A0ACB9NXY9_9MYRT|nr:hypothetical protein MLD38_025149 [Melastoma candidum]